MPCRNQIALHCASCASYPRSVLVGLDKPVLDQLQPQKSCISYRKKQVIYYEGTPPLGVFCINTGKVKISKTGSNDREYILSIAQAGDFLGYRSLISEEVYGASATVIEDARICFIPKTEFLSLLQSNSAFSQRLMERICRKLGLAQERLNRLCQRSVRERLATTILMLKETYGMESEESQLVDIILSREDLAGIVGTATETVIRLLTEFRKDGLIDFYHKKIRILNSPRLIREADLYA